ncbi:hypothetical protein B7C51_24795 (plasmid) [Paenibacillus larvae subsp. pulvifaciens]|uniref:Uncharacterized protein n=1 Tax=Paenibacillus larvae subsp. pulvifaciens TaxID=1477 RepID=A0A1V0UZP3_9BACL|nr:hypothetical protein [Paenibacillus larvae]ARF70695.1 hypothetical protein B7C51_24795 [Paenibacillus larvae subsp. pulvifaciens]
MNISNHFYFRYCQRILEMKDDKNIKQYIQKNKERIQEHALKMYSHSTFLYHGQLGDSTVRNYYIQDNHILITDSQNTCLVTIFNVDFTFGYEIDKIIINSIMNKILQINDQISIEEKSMEDFIEEKETKLDAIDVEIKALNEKLKLLDTQKKAIKSEIEGKRASSVILNKDVMVQINKLVNSIDYRKDLNCNFS